MVWLCCGAGHQHAVLNPPSRRLDSLGHQEERVRDELDSDTFGVRETDSKQTEKASLFYVANGAGQQAAGPHAVGLLLPAALLVHRAQRVADVGIEAQPSADRQRARQHVRPERRRPQPPGDAFLLRNQPCQRHRRGGVALLHRGEGLPARLQRVERVGEQHHDGAGGAGRDEVEEQLAAVHRRAQRPARPVGWGCPFSAATCACTAAADSWRIRLHAWSPVRQEKRVLFAMN